MRPLRIAGAANSRRAAGSCIRGRCCAGTSNSTCRAPTCARPGRPRLAARTRRRIARCATCAPTCPIDSGFLPLFPAAGADSCSWRSSGLEFKVGAPHGALQRHGRPRDRWRRESPPWHSAATRCSLPVTPRADVRCRTSCATWAGRWRSPARWWCATVSDYVLVGTRPQRGADASPDLAKAVEFLGPADAQGRRDYSLAGRSRLSRPRGPRSSSRNSPSSGKYSAARSRARRCSAPPAPHSAAAAADAVRLRCSRNPSQVARLRGCWS